jgi:hypothetical protein
MSACARLGSGVDRLVVRDRTTAVSSLILQRITRFGKPAEGQGHAPQLFFWAGLNNAATLCWKCGATPTHGADSRELADAQGELLRAGNGAVEDHHGVFGFCGGEQHKQVKLASGGGIEAKRLCAGIEPVIPPYRKAYG